MNNEEPHIFIICVSFMHRHVFSARLPLLRVHERDSYWSFSGSERERAMTQRVWQNSFPTHKVSYRAAETENRVDVCPRHIIIISRQHVHVHVSDEELCKWQTRETGSIQEHWSEHNEWVNPQQLDFWVCPLVSGKTSAACSVRLAALRCSSLYSVHQFQ